MRSRRWADQALLVSAVLVTRALFRSRFLYDIDSVNFALALDRFDPQAHQPHPPGYYLYVLLGRLVYSFTHDANVALVGLSIAASCGAVAVIYLLAETWFGRKAAVFAGALFVASPLGWFHGVVALVYIIEAFFSALIGYLCWRVYRGEAAFVVPSGIVLGIATGFRPSSILLLGPLWLLSVWKCGPRRAILGLVAVGLTSLAWFVPMIREAGGLGVYFDSVSALWRLVPGRQSVLEAGIALTMARICLTAVMYGLCFGSGLVALVVGSRTGDHDKPMKLFTMTWVLPGFLFFALVFFVYVNSGYLLVLSPPVFAWLGSRAASWHSGEHPGNPMKTVVIGLLAAANAAFFLSAPLYCTYRGIREFEVTLAGIQAALPRLFSPKDTLIVGFDSHFLGYRHAGYYLPDFLTVQYPEVPLKAGPRVFAVENRKTLLLKELPLSRFKKFVFFPLPAGEEYRSYVDGLRRRLPRPLELVRANGAEFLTGDSKDLRFLFPHAASAAP